ncbi:histamine H2 receptor-like [Paramuricea clavata]|uniref:Histamine H2 receptor-like n=1 Tax=Paramuricea clavata TaxID=317549 RepID=A0A6S7K987_PARCT|nr:histamine H2 receptor-like [Paramuricea clavata]
MAIESTFDKRCLSIAAPTELSFMTATISIVFILTNIPGNILVILAVFFDPNKNLRTPFNWLVVNLAAADLIIGFITEPFSVYYHIKEGLKKSSVAEELITIHMVYFISCTASVLSLTSLAVERYLAVRKPNTYRTKVTNKRIVLTIVMIWLISLSLPNIYLDVGFTTYGFIFANTSIAITVLITTITYTLMRQKINKGITKNARKKTAASTSTDFVITKTDSPNVIIHSRELLETNQTPPSISTEANNSPSQERNQLPTVDINLSTSNAITNSRQLLEEKITKMFLIVLIALLCCYGPSTIMMYLVNFCEDCSCITLQWCRDVHIMFALMNSSTNFFCYALRCNRFRSAFFKLLKINR